MKILPDAGDSEAIPSSFLAFFWLDSIAVPAPAQVSREDHTGRAANRWQEPCIILKKQSSFIKQNSGF
jgi:hypothetical protein